MYKLHNELRHYAWGSRTAMAELFARQPSGEPEAELWIGAHPNSPSRVQLDGTQVALNELLASDPGTLLGDYVAEKYGRLPFLLKILAAGAPLSLQVHPTREQAEAGFAAENAAGIPRDAPHRNYRDNNHKPEMLYALTNFRALCGFRPLTESAGLLRQLALLVRDARVGEQLSGLAAVLDDGGPDALETVFEQLLRNDDDSFRSACDDALRGLAPDADGTLLTAAALAKAYPGDPGPVLSLLLNLVTLEAGEAIWLPAGNVHAYLEGLGVEVMASSDNVLRGGLTRKHVDVDELLKTVDFASLDVPRVDILSTPDGQELLQPPCAEFQLQRIQFPSKVAETRLSQNGPALVLAVNGGLILSSAQCELTLARGESAFVPATAVPVTVTAAGSDTALAFAVTVPDATPPEKDVP